MDFVGPFVTGLWRTLTFPPGIPFDFLWLMKIVSSSLVTSDSDLITLLVWLLPWPKQHTTNQNRQNNTLYDNSSVCICCLTLCRKLSTCTTVWRSGDNHDKNTDSHAMSSDKYLQAKYHNCLHTFAKQLGNYLQLYACPFGRSYHLPLLTSNKVSPVLVMTSNLQKKGE